MEQSHYELMQEADALAEKFDALARNGRSAMARSYAKGVARLMRWVRDGYHAEILRTDNDD